MAPQGRRQPARSRPRRRLVQDRRRHVIRANRRARRARVRQRPLAARVPPGARDVSSRPMFTLAHVSDLHVSAFGDTLHDRARLIKRSARVADASEARFATCWEEAAWRVLRERNKKGERRPGRSRRLRAPDPERARQRRSPRSRSSARPPRPAASRRGARPRWRRAALERRRARARCSRRRRTTPTCGCLRAARAVAEHNVDAVVLTGDCTDDGEGWELVEAAFARGTTRGRSSSSPATMTSISSPSRAARDPRPTQESKRARWQRVRRARGPRARAVRRVEARRRRGRRRRRRPRLVRAPAARVLPPERRHRRRRSSNGCATLAKTPRVEGRAPPHRPLPPPRGAATPRRRQTRTDRDRHAPRRCPDVRRDAGRGRRDARDARPPPRQRAAPPGRARLRAARRPLAHPRMQERRRAVVLEGRAGRTRPRRPACEFRSRRSSKKTTRGRIRRHRGEPCTSGSETRRRPDTCLG